MTGDRAVGGHFHPSRFVSRHVRHSSLTVRLGADAGVFRVARQTNPEKPAPRPPVLALSREPIVVGQRERLLERLRIVAAIVDESGGGGEGVGVAGDEVATANLGRVEAEPAGEQVQGALHHERAHGHPDPTIGAERRLGGGERGEMEGIGGRPVGPGQDGGGAQRLERGGERVDVIRPGVRPEARPQRQQHAGRVGGRFDLYAHLPGVGRRGQVLASGLDPLHRAPGATGQGGHRQVLGHHVHLLAEAAPGIRYDHAHAGLGQAEGAGDAAPEDVRHLAAGPEREGRALPARDHAAALERRGGAARVGERLADHDRRAREGPVHVALGAPCLEEHVGVVLGVEPRRAGIERGVHVGHRGQRIVLDLDERAAVHGGVGRGAGHHRHRLADESDAGGGQRGPGGRGEAGRLEARLERRHQAIEVASGQHQLHAGHGAPGRNVHGAQLGVGVWAPHEGGVQQAGQRDVVEEATPPRQQAGRQELAPHPALSPEGRGSFHEFMASPRGAGPRWPAARAARSPS